MEKIYVNKIMNYFKYLLMFFSTLIFFGVNIKTVNAIDYIEQESTSLIYWAANNKNLETGYYKVTINGTTYPIHLYVYDESQTWSSSMTFGDANDIGTASTYAQHMVVVIVKGNLTISSGVTVTAYRSNYGGPKGFFIFATGTITNGGTITMTQRGAKAVGENVYLWQNTDGTYEYVPASGSAGGAKRTGSGGVSTVYNGYSGTAGTGRGTGGGGGGGMIAAGRSTNSGAGGRGTSYSGGAGGGGAYYGATGGTGSSVGGAGGAGKANSLYTYGAGGGAGNPVGACVSSCSAATAGTGGLLILYGADVINNGTISSNGSKGGNAYRAGGGGSGGGSINIFYGLNYTAGTITRTGGSYGVGTRGSSERSNGGAGGAGTLTVTQLILDEEYLNPTLSSLEVLDHTISPTFDPETKEYYLTLDSEDYNVDVTATVTHSDNSITSGVGNYDIPSGTYEHQIIVTSIIGSVQIYTINFNRVPSSYKYLAGITVDGVEIENFSPTTLNYSITVPYDSDIFELDVIKGRPSQNVYGVGETSTKSGDNKVTISVVSEDGLYTTDYTVNIFREHSSKLKSITIDGFEIEPTFDPEIEEYTVTVLSNTLSVTVDAVTYDEEATIKYSGFGYIKTSGSATITVTEPNSSSTTYKINIVKEGAPVVTSYTYSYTGAYQTFEAPSTGYFQIELWGAQGGNSLLDNGSRSTTSYRCWKGHCSGGYGAYTSGKIWLEKGEILYIYVGGKGANGVKRTVSAGGWNGGGSGQHDHTDDETAGGGGGATDVRLVAGTWNNFDSLKSRIMVAAGGGGSVDHAYGGDGGTTTSANRSNTYGVSQTSGYAFGIGAPGKYPYSNKPSAGGGGGYYGGRTSTLNSYHLPGSGGSSYVSGCTGCNSISETSTSGSITHTGETTHYSGYVFEEIVMKAGYTSMPNIDGTGYMTGKTGTGYAKITVLPLPSENNFLSSLTVKVDGVEQTYNPEFDLETLDYYVTLDVNDTSATISARPEDSTATIDGLGEYDIPAGETIIPITVTAESGSIRVYNVHITRPASDNPYPLDIIINGLVPSLCSVNSTFCILNPESFDKDTTAYYLTVPSRIKQLYFSVEKGHAYQTVIGEGKTTLDGGENIITIEVTSEDGLNTSVYKYYVTRDMTGNTDLSRLEIVDPEREINYDPDILEYYISVPNEYTQINELIVETDDENATYIISGNEDFETGMNQVYILVTAANGETKTYTINVYREKSGNTYVSNLEVIKDDVIYELTPEFNKVYLGVYQTTVPNEITEVSINATAEVDTTTISGTGTKTLSTGENSFNIIATAEDGSIETYQLTIYREKNSNANLASINAYNSDTEYTLTPTFDSEILEYSFEVLEGTTLITLEPTVEVDTTTYKLLDNDSIKVGENVKRIMTIAEDGTSKTYVITITRPASNNNYLNDLIVENNGISLELTPSFDKTINDYTIEVENEISSVVVTGIKENNLATIKGNGTYSLAVGENEIIITVTSETGIQNSYTISITRKPNSNPYLSLITTSAGVLVPEFDKDTNSYTMEVGNEISKITITGTPEEKTTIVTGNGTYSLQTGDNEFELVTLAEDGVSTLTYKIVITRNLSGNTNIASLIMKEGALKPTFDPETLEYTAKVARNVENGTFIVELEDENSTYEIIGAENFEIGENTVTIRVTAENGNTKDYIVVVTRQELTSNYLLDLQVDDYTLTPEFDKEISYYTLEVPYEETDVTVSAILEDVDAEIYGTGNYTLSVGKNLIVVEIESLDGMSRTYQIEITRAKDPDARLQSLIVNGSILSPNFNSDIYEYSLSTNNSALTFSKIEPVNSNATYEIIGNEFTEVGEYQVIIRVTAENGVNQKDYILNVTKNPSNNNNLSSLEVLGYYYEPEFNKSTTLYKLTVSNNVNSVVISATSEDSTATISGIGVQTLEVGENQIIVEVTSQSGNVKAYTILITKEGSSDNYIKSLILNNGILEPEFDSFNTEYIVEVPYEITSLDLEVLLSDENASYVVTNNNLAVGKNTVSIIVTAEDGSIRTYTINATRKEVVSALIKELSITNYETTPTFNSYINNYDVLIDYEVTKLDLNITTLDPNATYEITGNEDFVIGTNTVEIVVTASDGITKETYVLNVTRQAYSNSFLDYLYTDQGDVTPTFEKTNLTYTIDVGNDVTTIELIGEAVDKSATVTGLGEHSLDVGENKIAIVVTTTTGIKRTYYVTVNRLKDTKNYLESLIAKVGTTKYDLTPEFDSLTNEYEITVPTGTTSITFEGTISENATVTGFGTKTVVVGDNTYYIKVTSQSGETNTYTIVVNRPASSNNMLTDLIPSVGELEPTFTYDTSEYTLNLDSGAAVLSFTYTTEDLNSTVTGVESKVVPDGLSTREIIVTAEDGTEKVYTITINKERTDNAKLSSLVVSGYELTPEFDSDTYEYSIMVSNSVQVLLKTDVIAVPEDQNATINQSNNLALTTGTNNEYIITVTAPDGFTTQDYKIIVNRGLGSDSTLSNLIVNVGSLKQDFNPNVYEYTWLVKKSDRYLNGSSVTVTLSDSNATVVKTESLDILSDNPVYIVKVISESGENITEYKLNVEIDLSSDATLSNITIDNGYYEPAFDSNTFVYDVYEYVDVESIEVNATPTIETSVITFGVGEVLLENSETTHTILVTAEDGTTEIYTLNIHKTIFTDKGLKNITLNNLNEDECGLEKCILKPTFDTDIIEYTIVVPYEYTNLSINAEVMNEQQTVKYKIDDTYIETYDLPIGSTEVVIEVYDGMGELTSEYTLTVVRSKSNNNDLKSLSVTGYELDPTFDKGILEYTVYVEYEVEEVEILAEAEDEEATVYINGYTYLQEGNNDATVTVTAADGSTKTYIVHIIRSPLYNSYLKIITVSTGVFWNLSPTFKSTTYDYTTTVSGLYETVTIEAIPMSENTIVTGTGEFNVVVGSNIFTLTATAEDGSVSIYTINVIKENSRNVNITSLIVEEGNLSPSFEKGITKYDINVDEDVEKLTIHVTLEDQTSSYVITGNEHLISGENIVNVIVMSADKSVTKTYQLTVHKAISSNSYLSNLQVFEGDIEHELIPLFDKDRLEYTVNLNHDVEMVTIVADSENYLSSVVGEGDVYLTYGNNKKEIIVTAEDGTEQIYTINLYRNYNLDLKAIVSDIGELVPEFDKDILEYTIDIPTDEDEITFVAQRVSNEVDVEGSGTYSLEYGENEIVFTVVAPDGKTKEYVVIVDREDNSNNYIESLIVHEGILLPEFDRDIQLYEVYVNNSVTKIGMDIVLEDDLATYEIIGNENLQLGDNEVVIRVTAANGDKRNYVINVIVQEEAAYSNLLLDISITNGKLNPDFEPGINYYAATVANSITSTEITVVKENVDAVVTGIGVKNLELGQNYFQIQVTSKDGVVNTYTLAIYREENSDATLSSLIVKNHNFLPIFNKQVEDYTLEVDGSITDLVIEATPTDPNSTVEIIGNKSLTTGVNVVNIKVTAPDGITTKEYTITVTKGVSTNNYLSSLKVVGFDFNTEYVKTNQGPYIVNIDNNVNNIVIEGEAEVQTTTINGLGSYEITESQKIISIEATSESGEIRVYTIIVNKASNSNSKLKDIIVSDGTLEPVFDSNIYEYTVEVDSDLEHITVTGILEETTSTIKGNGTYTLDSANTEVLLEVIAEDSTSTIYKVNIVKDVTSSSKIEKLVIKEGEISPEFHKNTLSYTIKVPYEVTTLQDMEITLENENATYEVIGNSDFVVGNNIVTIRVTSDDGTSTTEYVITVIRQISASNYLKELTVVGYTLTPTFDKNTLYYVVEVPSDTTEVEIKATKEDSSATLTGTGTKTLTETSNRYYVTVTSASGSVRTYSVVINKSLEDENLLLTLSSSVGTLTPEFDPFINEYILEVPEKTDKVTLDGTSSVNSTVIGLGTSSVSVGEHTRTITVTSQAGEINVYTVVINRPASTNTELESLIPSSGTLEYSNDILEYTIEVEENVSVISFEATPVDDDAIIEGIEIKSLEYGDNLVTITVTAEDGITKRLITINVIRLKEIVAIIPSETDIILSVGEDYEITYTLEPVDTSYQEVEWIVTDDSIVNVENGIITGIDIGSTIVQIRSTHNPLITANINVSVINKEITSSVYDVNRGGEVDYVIAIEPGTKLSDFIPNFDNNPSTLYVYDSEGVLVTDSETIIGSHMTIKLVIKEIVYDELTIVVRGDFDKDGFVSVTDLTAVKNVILKINEETYIVNKICDIDLDGFVSITDLINVKNYMLGKSPINN